MIPNGTRENLNSLDYYLNTLCSREPYIIGVSNITFASKPQIQMPKTNKKTSKQYLITLICFLAVMIQSSLAIFTTELTVSSALCFSGSPVGLQNIISADILEHEKGIICANQKTVKLIDYRTSTLTSNVVVDITSESHNFNQAAAFTGTGSPLIIPTVPSITGVINYDFSSTILVTFSSYRAASYDLPSLGSSGLATKLKTFVLPNIINQGRCNPLAAIDIMKNQYNFLVADIGQGMSGVYKYGISDDSKHQLMIVISGIKIEKIKHIEQLNWISVSK